MTTVRVTNRGNLVRAIEASDPCRRVLLEAADRGRIVLAQIGRDDPHAVDTLLDTREPIIAWVPDDDDTPAGPAGWACASDLLQWPAVILLHCATPLVAQYETAVWLAERNRRLLLIEAAPEQEPAWTAWAAHPPQRPKMAIYSASGTA